MPWDVARLTLINLGDGALRNLVRSSMMLTGLTKTNSPITHSLSLSLFLHSLCPFFFSSLPPTPWLAFLGQELIFFSFFFFSIFFFIFHFFNFLFLFFSSSKKKMKRQRKKQRNGMGKGGRGTYKVTISSARLTTKARNRPLRLLRQDFSLDSLLDSLSCPHSISSFL